MQVSPGACIAPEEVISFCKERMAGYKVPKKVLIVQDFPRTASGKIQKVKLREQFGDLYTTEGVQA